MSQSNRLRGLEMGKAGHDAVCVLACPRYQSALQHFQAGIGALQCFADPQTEIGRDLIVAAARGVQTSCDRPDQFGQPCLHRHVNIFQIPVLWNALRFVFGGDGIQTTVNGTRIFGRDDILRGQHGDMRLRCGDILPPQRLVEWNRGVDFTHDRARPASEPAAPHLVGTCPHAFFRAVHVPFVTHKLYRCPSAERLR